jgi:hypothetical protein
VGGGQLKEAVYRYQVRGCQLMKVNLSDVRNFMKESLNKKKIKNSPI